MEGYSFSCTSITLYISFACTFSLSCASHSLAHLILLHILTLVEAEEQDLAHEANYALIQEHWRISGSERVLIPLSGDSYVTL